MRDETQPGRRPRIRFGVIGVIGLLVLSACGAAGSGNLITEERDVGAFTRMDISGGFDVTLAVDPGQAGSVTVTYDDNLIDNVVTRVDGDTLVIELDGAVFTTGGGRFITVVAASVEAITASGGTDLIATGMVQSLALEVSGGADVDVRGLLATAVDIDASGGADVWLYASQSLTGEVSGGADVSVYGAPAVVDIDERGGADLIIEE